MTDLREEKILDEAAAFAADGGNTAELQAWLARDPRHGEAYRAMSALTEDAALAEALRDLEAPCSAPVPIRRAASRRAVVTWAMAAAVAGLVIYNGAPLARDAFLPEVVYETAPGQVQTVRLQDGTQVTLNGGTRMTVKHSNRRVALQDGEAYFAVAHDPAHPFVIALPNGKVTVLGTKFDLELAPHGTELKVFEGRVRMQSDHAQQVFVRGEHGSLHDGIVTAPVPFDLQAADWRSGWIEPKDWTLEEVAAALSRRSGVPIRFAANDLKDKRISGRLRLAAPATQLKNLAEIYGFTVIQEADGLVLK